MKNSLELSFKSVLIGVILAILLCGANMYLGLKIGSTISASIPASILSLGILRMFKKYSILENNISQTIASSGEGLAGVVIYVFPALLILGIWSSFSYWQVVVLGLCGGFTGVAYSVLLRKVLLSDKNLPFPEGNAIGKVLLSTNNTTDKSDFKIIVLGIIVSATVNFCQNGLKVLGDSYFKFVKVGKSVIGLGTSFSPAVIGSGYLIGGNAIIGFIGLLLGWLVLIPYFAVHYPVKESNDLVASAFSIWKSDVRPVGIGVFLFSGIATILMMSKSIVKAVKEAFIALKSIHIVDPKDRDLSITKMMVVVILCMIPVAIILYTHILNLGECGGTAAILITLFIMFVVLILGFIIAAVAGYMVGMVGSSNSPISGLYFIAIIVLCLIFKSMADAHFCGHNKQALMEIVILLLAFIGFSAIITNENIQDYKSGQMVGASPYKQQISLFIGVACAILVAPLMINLIFNAYGIGGVVPHPGINPNETLSAPQASAVALITKHLLEGSASWGLLSMGMLFGAIVFIIDIIGKRTGKFRSPAIMLGMGLYLPPDLVSGLFVGGLLRIIIKKRYKKLVPVIGQEKVDKLDNRSNVLICGLIAGESLMGLFLSVPFVLRQSSDALRIVGQGFYGISQFLSLIVIAAILIYVYRVATVVKK